jgi:hypothetical protein
MTISSVTSEALQLKLRELLPSQQGFGTDLSASDTIIPIIDLTEAAEGSEVPSYLTNAINFGGATAISVNNATVALTTNTGFWRLTGVSSVRNNSSGSSFCKIEMTDGSSTKIVWSDTISSTTQAINTSVQIDLIFFVALGVTLNMTSNRGDAIFQGSIRQVADINGTLVNPVGFTPQ